MPRRSGGSSQPLRLQNGHEPSDSKIRARRVKPRIQIAAVVHPKRFFSSRTGRSFRSQRFLLTSTVEPERRALGPPGTRAFAMLGASASRA
jgi:hypothetical protein